MLDLNTATRSSVSKNSTGVTDSFSANSTTASTTASCCRPGWTGYNDGTKFRPQPNPYQDIAAKILELLQTLIQKLLGSLGQLLGGKKSGAGNSTNPTSPSSGIQSSSPRTSLALSGQFLWKPTSDKDGRLAILLPPKLSGNVASVSILSPDGTKTIEQGRSAGVGNGGREHFRFDREGAKYPAGSIVDIKLKDGSHQSVVIKNTAQRTTN